MKLHNEGNYFFFSDALLQVIPNVSSPVVIVYENYFIFDWGIQSSNNKPISRAIRATL